MTLRSEHLHWIADKAASLDADGVQWIARRPPRYKDPKHEATEWVMKIKGIFSARRVFVTDFGEFYSYYVRVNNNIIVVGRAFHTAIEKGLIK